MRPLSSCWFMLSTVLISFLGFLTDSAADPAPQSMDGAGHAANVSPAVAGVVKLAGSGTEENVLLAYINNSSSTFDLAPDNIAYLHESGLSSAVIAAMIRHDRLLHQGASAGDMAAPTSTDTTAASSQPNQAPYFTAGVGSEYDTSSPEVDTFFYNSLAPYGIWSNLPGYGWGWQPTVAANSPGWTPYCDGGQWFYTDRGWYWNSYYPWGWAPFHYGRWAHNPQRGWIWFPARVWSPAWVTWRMAKDSIGWAPLPPGSSFGSSNLRFNSRVVAADYAFGLPVTDYAFVGAETIGAVNLPAARLSSSSVAKVFARTRPLNNLGVAPDASVSNWGPDYNRITRSTHGRIVKAELQDSPSLSNAGVIPSRSPDAPAVVRIFRPQIPIGQQAMFSMQPMPEETSLPPLTNAVASSADPPASSLAGADPASDPDPGSSPGTSPSSWPVSTTSSSSTTASNLWQNTTSNFWSASKVPGSSASTTQGAMPFTTPDFSQSTLPGTLQPLQVPASTTFPFPGFATAIPAPLPAAAIPSSIGASVPSSVPAAVPSAVPSAVPAMSPPPINPNLFPTTVTTPVTTQPFRFHSVFRCPPFVFPVCKQPVKVQPVKRGQPFAPAGKRSGRAAASAPASGGKH